jgi:trehalose 6-phosphate phosphatase
MTPDEVADEVVAAAPHAGLLLDFDGTLAPIVNDPRDSRLPPGLGPVLARLAERLAVVAVVSGRPAAFLAEQIEQPGIRLLGLYGLEQHQDGDTRPHPDAVAWQAAVDSAREQLVVAADGLPGVWVEDKGLSVAVHWRNASDRAAAERAVQAAVADLAERTGLAAEPGKLVAELRPPLDVDKGTAVRSVAPAGPVVYVGDDLGDLAAFAAVRELGGRCLAVRHGDETPPELAAAADASVDGAEGVAAWLTALADRLG